MHMIVRTYHCHGEPVNNSHHLTHSHSHIIEMSTEAGTHVTAVYLPAEACTMSVEIISTA